MVLMDVAFTIFPLTGYFRLRLTPITLIPSITRGIVVILSHSPGATRVAEARVTTASLRLISAY